MNNRNTTNPSSEQFNNRTKKELENFCKQFSLTLYNDITSYVNGQLNSCSTQVVEVLQEGSQNIDSDLKSTDPEVFFESQSCMILDLILKPYKAPVSTYLDKRMKNMLINSLYSDVNVKVENEIFRCHKDVLCARSPYFCAMLRGSGRWTEANQHMISLNGLPARAVAVFLCYLYGAFIDVPCIDKAEVQNLFLTADMLGFDDMKRAVELFLQRDKCHFFHKPCPDCIEGIPSVLHVCEQFKLENLKKKCLKWNTKHFERLWPTKKFCSLPTIIQEQCYVALTEILNFQTVVRVTFETDVLIGHLTAVKWAMPAIQMANQLMSDCEDYISQHLYQLTLTEAIFPLFLGMGCRRDLVEKIARKVSSSLTTSNACSYHLAVRKLMKRVDESQCSPEMVDCFHSLDQRITVYLTANYYAVIHDEHWELLSTEYKKSLETNTMCQGDPGWKPRHKPVLSSSVKPQFSHRSPSSKQIKSQPKLNTARRKREGTNHQTVRNFSRLQKKTPPKKDRKENVPATFPNRSNVLTIAKENSPDNAEDYPQSMSSGYRFSNEETTHVDAVMLPPIIVHETLLSPLVSIPLTVFRPYDLNDLTVEFAFLCA